MTNKFLYELGRKTVHILSIFIIILYIVLSEQFSTRIALFILAFILIIFIEAEYLRLEFSHKVSLMRFVNKFKRKKEKQHLGGDVFFLLGAIIVLSLFDLRVAFAAILMTTFGDLFAGLVGMKLGKLKIWRKKTFEGLVAGLIANLIIGTLIVRTTLPASIGWLQNPTIEGQAIWPVILVMALTASTVELFIDKLDDNLLIPVFSGFNGQMVMLILQIPILTSGG